MAGASALTIARPSDPAEFELVAGPFLATREAENNLALGLTSIMKTGRRYGSALYFGVALDRERVVGAAMRAGLYLIVTAGTRDDALIALVEDAVRETPDAPGIVGPKALARRAVEVWTARTGQRARLQMAERIYSLTRVIAPRAASGHMRVATADDLDAIAGWFDAFMQEAEHRAPAPDVARDSAERWITGRGLHVWMDGGALVSMAGATGPTPHGIRIGAVYTPPGMRRRGYASALVAALSQQQLDSGKTFCFLYTDLANPTSNKIYQDIGYVPVIDVDQYGFDPA